MNIPMTNNFKYYLQSHTAYSHCLVLPVTSTCVNNVSWSVSLCVMMSEIKPIPRSIQVAFHAIWPYESADRSARCDQFVVGALPGHELVMCALFYHHSVRHHRYDIRRLDGRQPVRDHDAGSPFSRLVQSGLDDLQGNSGWSPAHCWRRHLPVMVSPVYCSQWFHSLCGYLFALCVQGGGGLIQEEDLRAPDNGSGDSNALFLSSG